MTTLTTTRRKRNNNKKEASNWFNNRKYMYGGGKVKPDDIRGLIHAKVVYSTFVQVETIKPYAFTFCKFLKTIDLMGPIRSSSSPSTSSSSSTIRSIGTHAFSSCFSLESMTLPETIESIGDHAFYRCESMENMEIPINAPVKKFGKRTFAGCRSLQHIQLPNCLEIIDTLAFEDCYSLMNVHVEVHSSSLKYIGDKSFLNCISLVEMSIPFSTTHVHFDAFENSCPNLRLTLGTGTNETNLMVNDDKSTFLDFFCYLNRWGRRFIQDRELDERAYPSSLWPLILNGALSFGAGKNVSEEGSNVVSLRHSRVVYHLLVHGVLSGVASPARQETRKGNKENHP